jgi:DNA-binding transcriptional regulator YhcF (GntR family)
MDQTTTKRVKVVGTEEYINTRTGELEQMQVTSIEDRDFNFTKMWMKNFISTLDIVGNQKTRLCFWIIDHVDKENRLIGTYRTIASQSGMSLDTVRITMKLLMDADFMRKAQNGVYVINPNLVFKGTRNARMNVLNQFTSAEYVPLSDEERLDNLMASIAALTHRADELRRTIEKRNQKPQKASKTGFDNYPDNLPGQMEVSDYAV